MRVPISWLKDYVDFDDTPKGLAEKLTFSGTEVEAIIPVGGKFEGVVVGEIVRVEKHPSADKLTLCTVNTGTGEQTVVCGAPNARVGLKAPFAPAGVTLPNGLKLEARRVRGVMSAGMLCAEDELGLSEDHTGLMELDAQWAPGTPLSEVLGPPDTVLEMDITPNRPDCLSLIGLAREVAALYGTRLRKPKVTLQESNEPVESLVSVEVEDADGCPRYTARALMNVRIGPSPMWMRLRLERAGIRSINNVVDITNYVMLECGQPLHAFDYDLLEGHRIVVRRFREGEKLATLDGIERPMDSKMLVIADARRPVAVAGVMGGAGSEIRTETTRVLLESAYFKPQDNRATAKRLGLSTESSYRFERGIDIESVEWASRRAAALMVELAGATVARGVIDVYPHRHGRKRVVCRYERLCRLLGLDATPIDVQKVFHSLELSVVSSTEDSCTVEVPAFRVDIEMEADLIEEYARITGLDRIPVPTPRAQRVAGATDRPVRALMKCRELLTGLGLREIMNYSYVADQLLDWFEPETRMRRVVLSNPVNLEQATLRPTLLPHMVETLGRNAARQIRTARFYEIGRVFYQDDAGRAQEEERLAVGLMGAAGRVGVDWRKPVRHEEMFLWTKGVWEALAACLRLRDLKEESIALPWAEEGACVRLLVEGEPVGVLGLVRGEIRSEWRMAEPVGVFELRLAPVLGRVFDVPAFKPVATYPCIVRDVALVVDDTLTHARIMEVIRETGLPELESVELFDVFRHESLGAGRKSMAYSLVYRSSERTLTDDEANRYHATVKAALKQKLSVEIREG